MIVEVGFGAIVLALLVTLYSIVASRQANKSSGEIWLESAGTGLVLAALLSSLGVFCLVFVLIRGNYEVSYVYSVTSSSMPALLRATALWAGQDGSLLFFTWVLAVVSAPVVLRKWGRDRDLLPWVIMIMAATLAFFLTLVIFVENPFARFWETSDGMQISAVLQPKNSVLLVPLEGVGLNPLLRHPGMVIHPPLLYVGFIGLIVPYAFAMAALIAGRTDADWLHATRRWTLIAWLFLSLGLVLGSRWAYDVLGWGGYWGWDPVEIAGLMPWLSSTAYIHSLMIQEKRGLFKRWNVILIVVTYALVIFGIFLTRSGLLSSVHAYAQSGIGSYFFILITVTFTATLYLLVKRWDDLRGSATFSSLFSRESLFLVNNLLFIGILAVCFWGVIFPLVSELLTGQKVTIGPPFYEQASAPLFVALLILMGIAPLSAWGRSTLRSLGRSFWIPLLISVLSVLILYISGTTRSLFALLGICAIIFSGLATLFEYMRSVYSHSRRHKENIFASFSHLLKHNRQRYGGYLVHFGILFMSLGIIGMECFQLETQGNLQNNQGIHIQNYEITYRDITAFNTDDGRLITRAVLDLNRDGQPLGSIYPRQDYYYDVQQIMTIPGVYGNLAGEVYTILLEWHPDTDDSAVFKVYYNPLINWLWIGSLVLVTGTLLAVWPDKKYIRS